LSESLAKQVSAYSVAAGAVLLMVTQAEAIIHLTTPHNPLVINSGNPEISLDMNGDGTKDFVFSLSNGLHLLPQGTYNGFVGTLAAAGTCGTSSVPKRLAAGAVINIVAGPGAGNLMSGGWYTTSVSHKYKCHWGACAQFNNGAEGYIGVTFRAEDGTLHAGWIHFTGGRSDAKLSGVIDKWAYEDLPSYPIEAGATTSIVLPPVDITASVTGGNGTITPSGDVKVHYDSSREFTFTGDKGYGVADVEVNGTSVGGAISKYTIQNVETAQTITVSFQKLPVAVAGPAQTVTEDTTVTLNGQNSNDPAGGSLSYAWTQTKGPSVGLSSPSAAATTFQAPAAGTSGVELVFQLTVTDSAGLTAASECTIHVNEQPPVAVAGPDQTVTETTMVTLNGSGSSDSDDVIKSYQWTQLNATPSTKVQMTNAGKAIATFKAPAVGESGTSLDFQLKVTNKHGFSSTDTCIVNISWDQPPIANPGKNQTVTEGATVVLDGSASSDTYDGIASYLWEQVSGTPPVTLSGATTSQATFTAPDIAGNSATLLFKLTVTDNHGLSSSAKCSVTVKR